MKHSEKVKRFCPQTNKMQHVSVMVMPLWLWFYYSQAVNHQAFVWVMKF